VRITKVLKYHFSNKFIRYNATSVYIHNTELNQVIFMPTEEVRATTYIFVYKLSIMKCREALDLKTLDK
jgi:hypothetical protein